MSSSIGSDTSIIEHDNSISKYRHLDRSNDPRVCYINSSEDLHCLHSSSGGLIKRILRNTEQIEVPPKYGVLIQTQVYHPGNAEKWYLTNALMSNTIKQLDEYWLAKETDLQLAVREGEISPKYNGKIQVAVFNKSMEKIIIPKNSAIAILVTSLYPYMSPSQVKYNLF